MNYVKTISEACGFQTKVDKLRIPSTKRVCFVGAERNYSRELHRVQEARIQEIIRERSSEPRSENQEWSSDFKPREAVEKVRNCTRLDKSLISDIIEAVALYLLKERQLISLERDGVEVTWNAGGTVGLPELAALLPTEKLKLLKKECGGLQTLLKNNGHVFLVEKGKVSFRNHAQPSFRKKRKVEKKCLKTKPCWFHDNHPDGCPLIGEKCDFRHDEKSAEEA